MVGSRKQPPGRMKIAKAFRSLIVQKDFNAITTAEISKTSGVNESLIYRYFGDKRGLMHQILMDIFQDFLKNLLKKLKGTKGTLSKLRVVIGAHFNLYHSNPAIAKILLLEVRNYPGYFESETYDMVRVYGGMITEVLTEGVKNHEIRSDISVKSLRQAILGTIEHLCLPKVIYGNPYSPDELTEEVCAILFEGIKFRE